MPEIPIVVIASRLERDIIGVIENKISKILYKPVYASKIIGALIEILYNEKTIDSDIHPPEKLDRSIIEAEALVAEDNAINQKLITLMLKEIGINADIANNGKEVIKKFKKNKYDIILMDINMPTMDGLEATSKILAIEKKSSLKHTPIIAITAKSIIGDREMILNAGMDDYLSKPISINKLYDTIIPYLGHLSSENFSDSKSEMRDNNSYNDLLSKSAEELGVGVEFIRNLIIQFIMNFDDYMTSLNKNITDMNYDAIHSEAHKIKGAAFNLRLDKLGNYFLEIEQNAKKKNEIDYNKILKLITEEFTILKNHFYDEH